MEPRGNGQLLPDRDWTPSHNVSSRSQRVRTALAAETGNERVSRLTAHGESEKVLRPLLNRLTGWLGIVQ
jgi:hypothetical protein